MRKVEITDEIITAMENAMAMDINAADYYVFETVAVNSKPLNKQGTLFHKAQVVKSSLDDMAAVLEARGSAIPLILDHTTYGEEGRPHGQVFTASVYDTEDGFHELRALFALPNPETDKNVKRAALTNDVDNGILNEVSIGATFKKLLSAETGFDFLGEDAEDHNYYNREDDEGNKIGEDTYLLAIGLDQWKELSFVTRGASQGARISSAYEQRLTNDFSSTTMFKKLAASGLTPDQSVLFSSASGRRERKQTESNGDYAMDKELIAQLAAKGVEVGTKIAELKASEVKVSSLTTDLEAANTALATANTDLTAANTAKDKAEADLAAAQATAPEGSAQEITDVTAFLKEHFDAAVVASGKTDAKGETLPEMIAFLKESGVKLHQVIGADGKSLGKDDEKDKGSLSASQKAFIANNRGK